MVCFFLFQWQTCTLAELSAYIAKCTASINEIYIFYNMMRASNDCLYSKKIMQNTYFQSASQTTQTHKDYLCGITSLNSHESWLPTISDYALYCIILQIWMSYFCQIILSHIWPTWMMDSSTPLQLYQLSFVHFEDKSFPGFYEALLGGCPCPPSEFHSYLCRNFGTFSCRLSEFH